jgi:hypothetical protein
VSADLRSKLHQIEEQLQLAMQEYPARIAIDRLKLALALTKFVRTQVDLDATVEHTQPGSVRAGASPQL